MRQRTHRFEDSTEGLSQDNLAESAGNAQREESASGYVDESALRRALRAIVSCFHFYVNQRDTFKLISNHSAVISCDTNLQGLDSELPIEEAQERLANAVSFRLSS